MYFLCNMELIICNFIAFAIALYVYATMQMLFHVVYKRIKKVGNDALEKLSRLC